MMLLTVSVLRSGVLSCSMSEYNKKKCAKRMIVSHVLTG